MTQAYSTLTITLLFGDLMQDCQICFCAYIFSIFLLPRCLLIEENIQIVNKPTVFDHAGFR